MAAYVISRVSISDQQAMKGYLADAPASVQAFGGKYLVRTGDITALEGGQNHSHPPTKGLVSGSPPLFSAWSIVRPDPEAVTTRSRRAAAALRRGDRRRGRHGPEHFRTKVPIQVISVAALFLESSLWADAIAAHPVVAKVTATVRIFSSRRIAA